LAGLVDDGDAVRAAHADVRDAVAASAAVGAAAILVLDAGEAKWTPTVGFIPFRPMALTMRWR
jgi:hypothetical protein